MNFNRPLGKNEHACNNCGEIYSQETGIYDNKKQRWCTTAEVRSLLKRGIVSAIVISHKDPGVKKSWDFGTLYFETDPQNPRYELR